MSISLFALIKSTAAENVDFHTVLVLF